MTHHNPISLSVEDLNNIDLSAEDAHKITLSVIDWFYTQILNAIVALASVALGAEAVMSTVSKIIGAAGVGLSGTANVVSPSKVNASAGVSVGTSGVAAVRSLLVAQSGAQFGAQVAARCPAIIIGSAGMGLGATAELDAGSVALWTPAVLGSSVLQLWLDANDESTITKDGSNYVSRWNDKSGNDFVVVQSTGSRQPQYDSGDKSINFTLDFMNFNRDPSVRCGFAVVRNANGGAGGSGVCFICGVEGSSGVGVFLRTNSSDYTISIDGTSVATGDASINGNDLQPGDGTGMNIDITNDGYTGFPTHNSPDLVYWQWSSSAYSVRSIATVNADFNYRSNIDFHEIIFLSEIPSVEIRQKAEGYLAHKWSFTDKLPSDHPYKTSPPTV
jgi:hypothetical protein